MQTFLIIIILDATIVEGIREIYIKTVIIQGIIIVQTIQQILKVHQIETKFPLKTREIIMSIGET